MMSEESILLSAEGRYSYCVCNSSRVNPERRGVLSLLESGDSRDYSLQFKGSCDYSQTIQLSCGFKVQSQKNNTFLSVTLNGSSDRVKFYSLKSLQDLYLKMKKISHEIKESCPDLEMERKAKRTVRMAPGGRPNGYRPVESRARQMLATAQSPPEAVTDDLHVHSAAGSSQGTAEIRRHAFFQRKYDDNLAAFNSAHAAATNKPPSFMSSETLLNSFTPDRSVCGSSATARSPLDTPEKMNTSAGSRHQSAPRLTRLPLLSTPRKSVKRPHSDTECQPERACSANSDMSRNTSKLAIGFMNLGNTCYMNAILQALLAMPTFCQDLLSRRLPSDPPICQLLIKLAALKQASSQQDMATVGQVLFQIKGCLPELFQGATQQDAHEFLSEIWNQLKAEVESCKPSGGYSPVTTSSLATASACVVTSNFYGVQRKTYACRGCGHASDVEEEFADVLLPLPEPSEPDQGTWHDMADMLEMALQNEDIEVTCNKCQYGQATLRKTFSRLPRILTLHANRVWYDRANRLDGKSDALINILPFLSVDHLCCRGLTPPRPFAITPPPSTMPVLTSAPDTAETMRPHPVAAAAASSTATTRLSSSTSPLPGGAKYSVAASTAAVSASGTAATMHSPTEDRFLMKPRHWPGSFTMPGNESLEQYALHSPLVSHSPHASYSPHTYPTQPRQLSNAAAARVRASAGRCPDAQPVFQHMENGGSSLIGGLRPVEDCQPPASFSPTAAQAAVSSYEELWTMPTPGVPRDMPEVFPTFSPSVYGYDEKSLSGLTEYQQVQLACERSRADSEQQQSPPSQTVSPSARSVSASSHVASSPMFSAASGPSASVLSMAAETTARPSLEDSPPVQANKPSGSEMYRLVAVVSHLGETSSTGHYVSDVMGTDGKWQTYDDMIVKATTEHDIRSNRSRTAVLFFLAHKSVFDAVYSSSD